MWDHVVEDEKTASQLYLSLSYPGDECAKTVDFVLVNRVKKSSTWCHAPIYRGQVEAILFFHSKMVSS